MNFRVTDTFTASLAKLTGNEQKAVNTTTFDLQLNPAHPGMQFHKLAAQSGPGREHIGRRTAELGCAGRVAGER